MTATVDVMGTSNSGLEGIVAATTHLSDVDGERGELVIAGFPVGELAEQATFEETTWLLWHGDLPSARQLASFQAELAAQRALPAATIGLLRECARDGVDPMDALRIAAGTISMISDEAPAIVARIPTIVATFWRYRQGDEPIAPRGDLAHAANFLYMLSGTVPDPERVRALETYLNTVVDHGLNASTFTCRVITSTGSDLVSSVVGALGALKGPLHGGAPGPALDMVFEIGDASRAEAILRAKIEAGEKLMGFGHRVYKVRDPRADVLAAAAERMYTRAGDMSLYTLARAVEATALRLLEEYKPGRRLQTNVEFYTALLLHGLGLEVPLFTPTFALSRVSGWIAHAFEQRRANRIIRPQSEYAGPRHRTWVPLAQRPAIEQAPEPVRLCG
jgi:citrate synthase